MPIGILNPGDLARTSSTRPAAVLTAINQRRWFSDALATEIRDQDLNAILGQLRYVFDFYSIPDVEGDEAMLQKAIAAGSTALSGNILALQNLVGAVDKVPFWTSPTVMSTFTASSYARGLLGKTSLLQWQDALGISTAAAPNIVALGALVGGADQLPYFTGTGTMSQTGFTPAARTLLDDTTTTAMRTTLGLGTMATQSSTGYAALAGATFTGDVAAPRLVVDGGDIVVNRDTDASPARLYLIANSGYAATVEFKADYLSANRWVLGKNTDAESTGDVGSNFHLWAYNDAGASLGRAFRVMRTTRVVGFDAIPTAPTATVGDDSTQLATTAFVTAAVGGGGSFQPLDPDLTALAGLSTAADKVPYFTGPGAAALMTVTAAARGVLDDTTVGAMLTSLGGAPLASPTFTGTVTIPTLSVTAALTAASGITVNNGFLLVDRAGDALMAQAMVASDAGQEAQLLLRSGGFIRWKLMKTGDAESGSDAGGNFSLTPYNDAGSPYATPAIAIVRATSVATFAASPVAPTPSAGDSTTKLATTAYVTAAVSTAAGSYQPLDATLTAIAGQVTAADKVHYFTGVDTASTMTVTAAARTVLDDTTVAAMLATMGGAPLASPAFTGNPTAVTQAALNNSTRLATTAYVEAAVAAGGGGGGQPLDATLTALSGLTTGADLVPLFTGTDVATTMTVTSVARSILDDTSYAAMLTTMGGAPLASPAFTGSPTIGGVAVSTLSLAAANTWTGVQTFANGTVSLPGLTFAGELDCGIRAAGTNTLSLVVAGTDLLNVQAVIVQSNASIFRTGKAGANSSIQIRGDAGFGRDIIGQTAADLKRWYLQLGDATAEAGSDAGSNFTLYRYSDAGAVLGGATPALTIYRATGGMLFGSTTTGGDKGSGTINATGLFVNGVAVSAGGGAALGSANVFTAQQTMTLATASAIPLALISTEAGALAGPILELYRDSATPAAADIIGAIRFAARDSAAAKIAEAASVEAASPVVTTGSAYRTTLAFKVHQIGGLTQQMIIAGGIVCGTSGVHQGEGTLNTRLASGLYEAGVAISAKYEPLGKLVAVDVKTANYTLVLADIGKLIEMNVASANTLTVPPNSTVAFAIGSRIDIAQYGAGQTTITPGAGVTIRSSGTKLKLTGLYAVASLYKRATDEWVAMGDLSA